MQTPTPFAATVLSRIFLNLSLTSTRIIGKQLHTSNVVISCEKYNGTGKQAQEVGRLQQWCPFGTKREADLAYHVSWFAYCLLRLVAGVPCLPTTTQPTVGYLDIYAQHFRICSFAAWPQAWRDHVLLGLEALEESLEESSMAPSWTKPGRWPLGGTGTSMAPSARRAYEKRHKSEAFGGSKAKARSESGLRVASIFRSYPTAFSEWISFEHKCCAGKVWKMKLWCRLSDQDPAMSRSEPVESIRMAF